MKNYPNVPLSGVRKATLSTTILLACILLGFSASEAVADGTEGLGPPGIAIAPGNNFVAAGTGMVVQPGTISFTIPGGATIKQVLLYWSGQDRRFPLDEPLPQGDNTIEVSNTGGAPFTEVIGIIIGGPATIFQEFPGDPEETDVINTVFRADITGLGLIGAGANTLTVQGLNFERVSNGAGILVILDDGSGPADLEVRDGQDWAFGVDPAPLLNTTVPQTFSFPAAPFERTATLPMFFGSVTGSVSGGFGFRPTSIDVTIDLGLGTEASAVVDVTGAVLGGPCGVFRDDDVSPISDLLDACDGEEWDTVVMEVTIPAGATTLTVHPLSRDDFPGGPGFVSSFTWVVAGLSVPLADVCALTIDKKCQVVPPAPDLGCEDKITATTLRYIGPGIMNATVEVDPDKSPTVTYSGVNLVSGVTILSMLAENDFTIDARPDENELGSKTTIRINGTPEVIHTSCSTPYVAGQPAPLDNPKGNPSPNWFVVNFEDKDGNFVEIPDPEPPADACTATASAPPGCPTEGKPRSLTFEVSGGNCGASANTQGSKFSCTDFGAIANPVDIVITKDASKFTVSSNTVNVGEQVTITATGSSFPSELKLELRQGGTVRQRLTIHTSCSAPLVAGNIFGGLTLVKFNGKSAGAEVKYVYTVTNNAGVLHNVQLVDQVMGMTVFEEGPFDLAQNETRVFMSTQILTETTTNVATVSGTLYAGGLECEASDQVTVTVVEPPRECTDKIRAMLLRYTGPSINGATVVIDPDKSPTVTYNVDLVSGVTILSMAAENNFTIDARPNESELGSKTKIIINGVQEVIHTSCSTPFVEGQPAPLDNPKGNPSPNWFVEQFRQKDDPVPSVHGLGDAVAAVGALQETPAVFALEGAYPNPFNPTTTIRFSLPAASDVRLVVYDVLGRRVQVLAEGAYGAGPHAVAFEASGLPSGTYFYRIDTAVGTATRMMVLAK